MTGNGATIGGSDTDIPAMLGTLTATDTVVTSNAGEVVVVVVEPKTLGPIRRMKTWVFGPDGATHREDTVKVAGLTDGG